MGAHRGTVSLVKTEARQSSHPRERLWVSSQRRRSHIKRLLNRLCRAVLPVFVYLGQLPGFFFHTCPALGPSLTGVCSYFSRWIPAHRPVRAWTSPTVRWHPLLFAPQGDFLHMCGVPKIENMWPLDLLHTQGLAPFCPCHDCYSNTSTAGKVQLFTLFLAFPSPSANRSLV